jgi:hypothetical protein
MRIKMKAVRDRTAAIRSPLGLPGGGVLPGADREPGGVAPFEGGVAPGADGGPEAKATFGLGAVRSLSSGIDFLSEASSIVLTPPRHHVPTHPASAPDLNEIRRPSETRIYI